VSDGIRFSDIARMSLFRGFNDTFVRLLDLFFVQRNYLTGDTLIRQGTRQDTFFLIIAGEVEITHDVAGRPVQLCILPAGQFFGEINLFDPGTATASVTALTPVVTLEISNEKFRSFITHKPELAADFTFQLAETIVKRFRASSNTLVEELSRPEKILRAQQTDRGPVA
jgi:CRP-like cAMP-binding protein